MSEMMSKMQWQVKKKSSDFGTYIFRVMTGGWIGMVFAHMLQMMFEYGNFLFLFVIILMTGTIVRVTKGWGLFSVLLLNLFCILVGTLLQLYIQVAPGT